MHTYPLGATDVTSSAQAREATGRIGGRTELAVDVEADSMHAFRARLCFVQVGTDEEVFLFDTLSPDLEVATLSELLRDPARIKYFHAAGGDLTYLAEAGLRVKGLFDTHRAATLLGWEKVGLADLARERLGVTLAKEHQQADFSQRPLPPELRSYIADDVRYLCEIGRQVRAECVTKGILEEVELDCERLCDEAASRPAIPEFTPKLARDKLSAADYAVGVALAQALHERRLKWAEAANLPMGRVLSNAAINALAMRPAKTLKELGRTMGVRGAVVREKGQEILDLIQALQKQAETGELAPPPKKAAGDPKRRKRDERLREFRAQKAKERGVTPSVVLPNALVEALAQQAPADLDALRGIPYFGEKRVQLYGRELVELLARP